MSLDWISIARPYAKAAFELAVENQTLKAWSETLGTLALVANQPEAVIFMKRPDVSTEKAAEAFIDVLDIPAKSTDDHNKEIKNFVQLLAQTKRLGALPAIQSLYEHMRADYEKTIEANVVSFEKLTKAQQDDLALALKKRLKRDVNLTVEIDKALLGGAIVHAGDLVVDGSIRGKLHRLNEEMMK